MFYLIMALAFNPTTHQTAWGVSEKSFQTYDQCTTFAQSQDGQKYLADNGALSYNCDQLKGAN